MLCCSGWVYSGGEAVGSCCYLLHLLLLLPLLLHHSLTAHTCCPYRGRSPHRSLRTRNPAPAPIAADPRHWSNRSRTLHWPAHLPLRSRSKALIGCRRESCGSHLLSQCFVHVEGKENILCVFVHTTRYDGT